MQEIILYICDIDKLSFDNLPYLKEEDFSNAYRYKMANDQKQHLLSSYLKRRFIGDYKILKDGKPVSKDLYFSVSHAANLVVMGLSKNSSIGVDIENYCALPYKVYGYWYLLIIDASNLTIVTSQPTINATVYYI